MLDKTPLEMALEREGQIEYCDECEYVRVVDNTVFCGLSGKLLHPMMFLRGQGFGPARRCTKRKEAREMGLTAADLQRMGPEAQRQVMEKLGIVGKTKAPKYHNQPDSRGNLRFDSKKEARRYDELMLMLKAGQIRNLRLQQQYTLQESYITEAHPLCGRLRLRAPHRAGQVWHRVLAASGGGCQEPGHQDGPVRDEKEAPAGTLQSDYHGGLIMAKKGTFPANAMRRGEIYWVDIPNAIGHELMKDRPAIIVSCDALNDNSPVVQVVYCSASPKKELPEHITIRSTEQISTALCENVYTVDKSRVGRYVGRCTKREMEQVDLGLLSGLGLAQYGLASPQEDEEEPEPVRGDTEDGTASMALVIAQTERDTYKRMYESLLARMTMEREETA